MQRRIGLVPGVLLCLAIVAGGLLLACGDDQVSLPGTVLDRPSPDFRLTDQEERVVALSDLRGNVVILTFLYTSCPDICPVTAGKLRRTVELLGKDATRVTVIAVSVDPEGDTAEARREFGRNHGLANDGWRFVGGTTQELYPVWAAYGVTRLPAAIGAATALGHTDAVYLIDRQGHQRALLRGDFDPSALAEGVRDLAK